MLSSERFHIESLLFEAKSSFWELRKSAPNRSDLYIILSEAALLSAEKIQNSERGLLTAEYLWGSLSRTPEFLKPVKQRLTDLEFQLG